jgi:hypothetical protein
VGGLTGTDAVDAQRKRKQRLALDQFNRLSGNVSAQSSIALPDGSGRVTLAAAAKNTSPAAKLVVLIPTPCANIAPQLIRSSVDCPVSVFLLTKIASQMYSKTTDSLLSLVTVGSAFRFPHHMRC